jgi:Flp pilus assembly protein TadG
MYSTVTNRAYRRAEDRARHLRQRRPPARRRQRGQTLVIFALSVTVLLGLASLAIDAMRAYDLYAREERAAEAGALAGVIYMPCVYDNIGPVSPAVSCSTTTSPDELTARKRALQEVQKNGFGTTLTASSWNDPCTGLNTTAEVTVCGVANRTNALQVTITEPITTFLLFTSIGGGGAQSFMVTATAGADYFSSFVLGNDPTSSNSNGWGDGDTSQPKYWLPVMTGPAEFAETGSPYVYCQEGPSNGPLNPAKYPTIDPTMIGFQGADINLYQATPGTLETLGQFGASTGNIPTNHAQYIEGPHCGAPGSAQAINGGNPDQQPPGFDGEATRGTVHDGADNYAIFVPSATSGIAGAVGSADVWIWNPAYDPTDPSNSCTGNSQEDRFPLDTGCNTYYQNYGLVAGTTSTAMIQLNSTTPGTAILDDPRLYFDMTYSVYKTTGTTPGTVLDFPKRTYTPIDTISNDVARHNCTATGAYDPAGDNSYYNPTNNTPNGTGCVSKALKGGWVDLGNVTAGLHRLAVEASPYQNNGPNPACGTQNGICGWGRHVYSILVCAPAGAGAVPSGSTCPNGTAAAKISAWNNMDMYINFPSANQTDVIPLAYIPADFAGHTIDIGLYDPGDAHTFGSSNWFIIVPPDCTVATNKNPIQYGNSDGAGNTQPAWARTANWPSGLPPNAKGCQSKTSMFTSQANPGPQPSDGIYNGLWIWTQIHLPDNYNCGTSCEWYVDETSSQGKDFDQFTIAFHLDDTSPVHIIF